MRYDFEAELVEWAARRNWFFLDLPEDVSDEIARIPLPPLGFGSVRVHVTIGGTSWTTSIFPGATRYSLPVKRRVRDAEGLEPGDVVAASIRLLDVP